MREFSRLLLIFLLPVLYVSCSQPLIKTVPEIVTDTTHFIITCNAAKGNKGLKNFEGPVYVHLGLITDSSLHPNEWRYVKFNWGSTESRALAKRIDADAWSYEIPNIREFFGVKGTERVTHLAVLFRAGNCIDTNCLVLRNEDKSDIQIPVATTQK